MITQPLPGLEGLCMPQRAARFAIVCQWMCWHCPSAHLCPQNRQVTLVAHRGFVPLRQKEEEEGRKGKSSLEKAKNSKETSLKKGKKQQYLG